MTRRVDAHQHFWKFSAKTHAWINGEMQILRRNFLPSHLIREMISTGVDATIAVQASQTMAETEWLLKLPRPQPENS